MPIVFWHYHSRAMILPNAVITSGSNLPDLTYFPISVKAALPSYGSR